jgi:hypothetical protein
LVRRRFLLVVSVLALVLLPTSAARADPPSGDCNSGDALAGTCVSGSTNGDGVDLSGNSNQPGTNPGNGSGGNGGNNGGSGGDNNNSGDQGCPPGTQPIVCDDQFGVIPPGGPGNPAVTINDLKNFKASPGTDHMEPNGWMVVGLSTNFYSVVGTQIVNGTLLGQPASVRFIPISWHWTYGDGNSATRSTKGATWATLGIPEFTATQTSHVYSAEGTYYIDLDIQFRADYKFAGSGWTPVVGTITLPANRLKAIAGNAKTVLVGRACTQRPSGPGC